MSRFLCLLTLLLALVAGTPAAAGVYTWKGLSGDWSNAQSWSPAGVPSAQDTAIINSGSVTVSAPVELLHLEFNQGTLTRNADLTVHGGFRWTSGTINGPGAIHLKETAHSEIVGSSFSTINSGALNNAGVLKWTSGDFWLVINAQLNNTGVFEAHSNGSVFHGFSTFGFNNSGTFRKVAGAGVTEFQPGGNFNNSGLVEVLSGTLAFSDGTSSGRFEGAAGTVLRISGRAELTAASAIETAGDLDFGSAARVYLRGSVGVTGETRITGGEAHLSGTVSRMGSLRSTGGTLDLSTNDFTVSSFHLSGLSAKLEGTASVTATQALSWAGGTLRSKGALTAGPQSQAEIGGSTSMGMSQGVLKLQGTSVWTSTSGLGMSGDALIQNEGSFDVLSKGNIGRDTFGAPGLAGFKNVGTFNLMASQFLVGGGVRFSNEGLVTLQSGTLNIGNGVSTGHFQSMPEAVLAINQGWQELAEGASLDLQGPLTITHYQGLVGGLRISGAVTLPGKVVLDGGMMAPDGVATLTGQLEWLAGDINGSGRLIIEPGAVLLQKGAAQRSLMTQVENRGSILIEGTASINLGNKFSLDNTGLIELRADAQLGGIGAFNNQPGGVVRKAGGTGSAGIGGVAFNNRGTVEAVSGDLAFNSGYPLSNDIYTQKAGATILKGGSISSFAISSGSTSVRRTLHIDGGVLGGQGVVKANVISAGAVRPGLDEQTTGTLQIDGVYTQTAAGALRIGIGGSAPGTGYGRLDVTEAKLDGTLDLVQLRGYVPAPGEALIPLRWLGGIRTGGFSTVNGQDFGPEAFLLYKYTASDLTLYNSRASLSDVDTEVVGPGAGRPGTPVIYTVRIRNNNPVPMIVPVVLHLQQNSMLDMSSFEVQGDPYADMVNRLLPGTPIPPPPGPGEQYPVLQRYFSGPATGPGSGENHVPLWVVVPAGGSYEQSIKTGCGTGVSMDMGTPFNADQLSNCLFAASGLMLEFVPGYDCMKMATTGLSALANNQATGKAIDQNATLASIDFSLIQCAGDVLPATKAIKVLSKVNEVLGKAMAVDGFLTECGPYFKPDSKGGAGKSFCAVSRDPNDKVGPEGFSAAHDITGAGTLNYAVFFENDPDANAPAQRVLVTDTLDATAVDFSTFSFGTFTWGATTVEAPAGSKTFVKDVDMRPAKDLIVRVEAGLNEFTGAITWSFTSLDPETMLPTEDPLAGFLPPNRLKPEGQGTLTYSVKARPNLVNGTTFGSGARIIFDTNEPIDTQPWTNRLDTVAPESHVLPLSLDSEGRIVVTWTGADAGAGVKDYSIFVSVDGGEYTKWLPDTASTTARFTGELTHHYAFYSGARDLLDHVEAAPLEPDATSEGLGAEPVCPAESLGSPTLMLNGSAEMTLECGQATWADPGATAQDGCGFPLEVHRYNSGEDSSGPGPNTSAEGTYAVEYIAWDASGATVSAIRSVHVEDRTAPTLQLKGAAHMTHTCGSAWVDPGVEAVDACYGDVTATVSQSGYVNGWVAGQYTVTYSVTDSGGNSAPAVSRTVDVVNCPW